MSSVHLASCISEDGFALTFAVRPKQYIFVAVSPWDAQDTLPSLQLSLTFDAA